jgi:hypothetical protein
MLILDRYKFQKLIVGTSYTKLVFLDPVGSMDHVVHCGASGARNIDALFFLHGWDRYRFHRICMRTAYAELLFLHPVVSVGDVLHFGASGAQNIDALYFMLEWDQCSFHKSASGQVMSNLCFASGGICGSRSTFWCIRGVKRQSTILHARVGLVRIIEKARWDMLCRTCVFASG